MNFLIASVVMLVFLAIATVITYSLAIQQGTEISFVDGSVYKCERVK